MRILVTGGAGLVGSHAADYFAQRGDEVVILDALIRSQLVGASRLSVEHNWKRLQANPRIRCVQGDVRNWNDLMGVLDKPVDAVIHAAGQPGVGYSLQHPLEDFQINALGTLNVLEAIRQRCPKARVVFCSTNKVYGENVDRFPITEQPTRYAFSKGVTGVSEECSTDLTGHTPYGVSKLAGELYVQDYAHSYGLQTAVFRMSCIYGEHQFGFEDQGWVAHFIISSVLGRPVTVYGDGKQVRDTLYVRDLVRAFDLWISGGHPHAVFNIGGGPGQTLSLLELLETLKRETGRDIPVSYAQWRPRDQKVYISDIRRVSASLAWQPTVPVADGIRRLLGWVRANTPLFGDA